MASPGKCANIVGDVWMAKAMYICDKLRQFGRCQLQIQNCSTIICQAFPSRQGTLPSARTMLP